MTIVVGYVPRAEGRAALRHSARGGAGFDDDDNVEHEKELADVRASLDAEGIENEVRQLVRGHDPAEDLIAVAGETGADFIVIGLRRRTPVGKLILGSNAQRILLEAPCPVLAVKADED
jgi:nucleotide-binding universal stress UspA family protein